MTFQREKRVDGESADRDSFVHLLGGRTSAVDATLPPVAFGAGWFLGGESIEVGGVAAIAVAAVIGGYRLSRGARPLAVLVSLLAVLVGALIALRTGDAADFFLPRLVSNALSALVWMISIVARWPLLGVVVGTALRQGKRWRQDPDLVKAYGRASWVWVGQYLLRLAVFIPLWSLNLTGALTVAQLVLTWPLVLVCVLASWPVLNASLPDDHPGFRHPRATSRT